MGKERVHFQAPDSDRLELELDRFLEWFNTGSDMDPVLKAAVAHFWLLKGGADSADQWAKAKSGPLASLCGKRAWHGYSQQEPTDTSSPDCPWGHRGGRRCRNGDHHSTPGKGDEG
jgi:hypothetical protein